MLNMMSHTLGVRILGDSNGFMCLMCDVYRHAMERKLGNLRRASWLMECLKITGHRDYQIVWRLRSMMERPPIFSDPQRIKLQIKAYNKEEREKSSCIQAKGTSKHNCLLIFYCSSLSLTLYGRCYMLDVGYKRKELQKNEDENNIRLPI